MDPAFPDIVREWAAQPTAERDLRTRPAACNDDHVEELADPLLAKLARLEIDATRVW